MKITAFILTRCKYSWDILGARSAPKIFILGSMKRNTLFGPLRQGACPGIVLIIGCARAPDALPLRQPRMRGRSLPPTLLQCFFFLFSQVKIFHRASRAQKSPRKSIELLSFSEFSGFFRNYVLKFSSIFFSKKIQKSRRM